MIRGSIYSQSEGTTRKGSQILGADDARNTAVSVAVEVSAKVAENRKRLKQGKSAKDNVADLKEELNMDEHLVPLEELYSRYNTNVETGLPSAIAEKMADEKPNRLTPQKQTPAVIKFLLTLFGGFSMLLWIGGVLAIIAYIIDYSRDSGAPRDNLYLGVVLIAVVCITSIFSYYQEAKSDAVMKGFLKMQPQRSHVLRDGKWSEVDADFLVVGDIITVTYGNVVPADIRIITASSFKVDNSSLTGEAEALSRSPECTDDNPMETKNLAFYSTNAVEGTCTAIVLRTGDDTFIGKIARLVGKTKKKETPIRKEIRHFIHLITGLALFLGAIFFTLAMTVQKQQFLQALVFLIGIIVANVPEGLLATVTVSLTLTARKMAKNNVIVKNLEAVETLGSTSCICSDKTGTLTQNRMTVNHLWYDLRVWAVDPAVEDCFQKEHNSFKMLYSIATLNSRATFEETDQSKPLSEWRTSGDASESALIKFCQQIRPISDARKDNPKVAEIPFNSTNKYAVTVCEQRDEGGRFVVYMKGAPERVLARCSKILVCDEEAPLDDTYKEHFEKAYKELGGLGERVLGFAYHNLDTSHYPPGFQFDSEKPNFPCEGLVFAGLYALIDPPRPAVPSSVKACQSAGIRVIMVTGDHPLTAKAIARSVNIIRDETVDELAARKGISESQVEPGEAKAIVVSGQKLKEMDEEEVQNIIRDYDQIVFARTSPQQKLVIVEAVQNVGNVVAVTGDGVNDSPALRQADIGVAMGIAGTDVSKSAADMILLDDDFSSIVKGVEEGRLIFDNIKKSIAYTLTSNIPELTPFLVNVLLNIPLPLSTIMILCIDLGTDMYPAISLAYESAESDIMKRRPRDSKKDKLVNNKLLQITYLQIGVLQACAGFFNYLIVMGDHGFLPKHLKGLREQWDNRNINNLRDSYGQEWTYESRKNLESMAQTAFLLAIVQVQWADLIICKTRMLSILHQGMRNKHLIIALIFETTLIILLTYAPGMSVAFRTYSLKPIYWVSALPFACLILLFDEMRKLIIRKYPQGWVRRNLYY